jgi:hypothetical protein
MAKRGNPNPAIENAILDALLALGDLAVSEDDLKFRSGVSGLSFKEAIIRLTRKSRVVKWKSENYVNYITLTERAGTAYYEEQIQIDPLYIAFGHSTSVVKIKRSIPFVSLQDEELRKERSNRYRDSC